MYLEKFRLGGKTAIVTGGAQGIGLACVEALAEAGARVVIADRDAKLAETANADLKKKGFDTETVNMDVTDSKRVAEVADQLASRHGKVEQYGSPLELYEKPANLFVAGFIGSPRMNFIAGDVARQYGAATIGVRPEHLKVEQEGKGWQGTVSAAEHLGSDTFLYVDAGPVGQLTARYVGELDLASGDKVSLSPEPARIHRFDDNGNAFRP